MALRSADFEPEAEQLVNRHVRFPADLDEWLRDQARGREVPVAGVIREAVEEYRLSRDPQLPLFSKASPPPRVHRRRRPDAGLPPEVASRSA